MLPVIDITAQITTGDRCLNGHYVNLQPEDSCNSLHPKERKSNFHDIFFNVIQLSVITFTLIHFIVILFCLIQFCVIQFSLIPFCMIQLHVIHFNVIQLNLMYFSVIQISVIKFSVIQFNPIQFGPHHGMHFTHLQSSSLSYSCRYSFRQKTSLPYTIRISRVIIFRYNRDHITMTL